MEINKTFMMMAVMLAVSITIFMVILRVHKNTLEGNKNPSITSLVNISTIIQWNMGVGVAMLIWLGIHLFNLDEYTTVHLLVVCVMMYVQLCIMVFSEMAQPRYR